MSQKYAAYDINGVILGFYSDDIHTPDQIPSNSIPITDAEWQDCLQNQGLRMIDVKTKKIVVYTPPPPTTKQLLDNIRKNRDVLLAECDWTQIPDVLERGTLTQEQVDAWKRYRKALCDLPATCDPNNPVFPSKPF